MKIQKKCAMNGIDFIIDTNVLIAINTDSLNTEYFLDYQLGISSISEAKVLDYKVILPIDILNYKRTIEEVSYSTKQWKEDN